MTEEVWEEGGVVEEVVEEEVEDVGKGEGFEELEFVWGSRIYLLSVRWSRIAVTPGDKLVADGVCRWSSHRIVRLRWPVRIRRALLLAEPHLFSPERVTIVGNSAETRRRVTSCRVG